MVWRMNSQYILEGLAASFMFTLGSIGFIVMDKMNEARVTKLNRVLLMAFGISCIVISFITLRIFIKFKLPRPTLDVFLDLKAAFDFMDRQQLWECPTIRDVSFKFLSLMRALCANSCGCVQSRPMYLDVVNGVCLLCQHTLRRTTALAERVNYTYLSQLLRSEEMTSWFWHVI
ncbi:hypothetical protein T265_06769 [Opisthorchis viverrini]|uniref:Oligosaccharyltransferase complex subunit n=1 Tax=Opisthorchis viverrini TaxID=6198 RepID=A0A074ZEY2_OPIVI|nr:hypothetical protein T265_06769 [Opisthorchis viverrini]KER25856.1 hypothetical protein T265_06769 [Opisthorchis viverrini]